MELVLDSSPTRWRPGAGAGHPPPAAGKHPLASGHDPKSQPGLPLLRCRWQVCVPPKGLVVKGAQQILGAESFTLCRLLGPRALGPGLPGCSLLWSPNFSLTRSSQVISLTGKKTNNFQLISILYNSAGTTVSISKDVNVLISLLGLHHKFIFQDPKLQNPTGGWRTWSSGPGPRWANPAVPMKAVPGLQVLSLSSQVWAPHPDLISMETGLPHTVAT